MPSPDNIIRQFSGSAGHLTVQTWEQSNDTRKIIVFAHGGGQTRHSWRRTANRLHTEGWAVATYDARGHGDSAWSSSCDYGLEHQADDVIAVVEQLNEALDKKFQIRANTPRRPVLVGASMGGAASLIGQSRCPELASALVLVDVVPRVEHKGLQRVRDFLSDTADGFNDIHEVAQAVTAYNHHRIAKPRPEGLRKNVRERNGRLHWHWDPEFISSGQVDQTRLAHQLEEAALGITVPTLLIRGANSDIVSPDGAAQLQELIPHAQVSTIADVGHMVAGDDNDQFTSQLNDFLDQQLF
ncbi:hypothetical protein CH282_15660 [Rhodococcus sp. 06-418-1B]|nr:alpha/beta hydrolase [Rhodococcus sp. 06-418-1B]OZC83397.1 hypothetical protein CH282_15660 [Rhodococcus sp. 06-418-1B]